MLDSLRASSARASDSEGPLAVVVACAATGELLADTTATAGATVEAMKLVGWFSGSGPNLDEAGRMERNCLRLSESVILFGFRGAESRLEEAIGPKLACQQVGELVVDFPPQVQPVV